MLASPELVFLVALIGIIAAITIVDLRHYRIPNALNLTLFIVGLGYVAVAETSSLPVQLVTSIAVGLVFYLVRHLHSKMRGSVGLGLGDVKMAAAVAVWIHPLNISFMVLISSGAALMAVAIHYLVRRGKITGKSRIPFGPFLGFGLLVVWLMQAYGILH